MHENFAPSTQMTDVIKQKQQLRKIYREKRRVLCKERRQEAAENLCRCLLPLLSEYTSIASFASLPEELNTLPLNQCLLKQKCLALPRVTGQHLQFFYVTEMDKALTRNCWDILEPNPLQCSFCSPKELQIVLVPGIAFDGQGNRLGLGQGFYDRFLTENPHIHSIAIGFKEQRSDALLPHQQHDVPVREQYFF